MTTATPEQALACAAATARSAAHILPSTFRAAVTRVDQHQQEYRRTAYVIDSRTVRLGVATAHGTKKAQIAPRPDPRGVDPWQVDPRTLADTTRAIALCPSCEGTKKRPCSPCGGIGQVRCGACGGGGRVAGQRGLKNCPSCRGHGTRRCSVCNGKAENKCETCEGLGRVRAWLELEASRRTEVRAHPLTGPVALHAGLTNEADVERDPSLFPFPLASDTGWARTLPPGLGPELIVTIDPFTDRIASRRLQVFRATVFHCHYETLTGAGVVQVTGLPPQVLPESQWSPWQRRWLVALAAGGLMLVLTTLYIGRFTSRAEWFAHHPIVPPIGFLGFVAALLAIAASAGFCLPRRARGWARFRLPLLGLAGAWACMLLLWLGISPSPEGVRAAIERGDLQAAKREAAAVEADHGASDALLVAVQELNAAEADAELRRRQALDDEHMQRVERSTSVAGAAAEVAAGWELDEARQKATELLLQRADTEMAELFERHEAKALQQLAERLAPYDEPRASRARARQALSEAFACQRHAAFACVAAALERANVAADDPIVASASEELRRAAQAKLEESLKEPSFDKDTPAEVRRDALQVLLDNAKAYADLTGRASALDEEALRRQLAGVERTLEKQRKVAEAEREREAKDAERKERDAERKAERAARREEARRARAEAAERRREDRVVCCDGWVSGCRQSQGSLRGCCSWHGGIC